MTDTAMPTTGGWRATSLAHQLVVNVNGGQSLGEVGDLVFDPGTATVAGLLVAVRGHNASLLEVARRAFGGTMGLTYVDLDHVVSLNSDVVTVDVGDNLAAPPRGPLPRLSGIMRFDVITLHGKRLGQLADLLLDHDGRRVVGYLVSPPDARTDAAPQVAQPPTEDLPEVVSVEPETTPAASIAPSSRPLLVVGSDQGVRIGRDLIIVAGPTPGSQTSAPSMAAVDTPLPLRPVAPHGDSQPGGHPVTDTGWQVYEPDAPTEEIRR
jgi:sporulation protein YlmC with PRC-barrel domain